jgi:hypothetical protein
MSTERFDDADLMEVFGTTGVSIKTIHRWKMTWREDVTRRIEIKSFTDTMRLLENNGVSPLFYQFNSVVMPGTGSNDRFFVVFYKPEHEVFFKLHQGLA